MTRGTVLILGNGYDIAHGLPTSYQDFMRFCIKTTENLSKGRIEFYDYPALRKAILRCISDNGWYDYFVRLISQRLIYGERWVDFESEIQYILELIDSFDFQMSEECLSVFDRIRMKTSGEEYRFDLFLEVVVNLVDESASMRGFRDLIYNDCKRLIDALHIYLCYVEEISEIEREIPDLEKYTPDFLISFNYTHTYQKLHVAEYSKSDDWIQYIHGECDREKVFDITYGSDNLVLGIDDYMDVAEEKQRRTSFVIFDKYVQRVRKRTGLSYIRWLERIEKDFDAEIGKNDYYKQDITKVIIFGHSLGVSDRDVLAPFLASPATEVTIYCYDEASEGDIIENVIRLIGKKRLLEKVNNYLPLMYFRRVHEGQM